MRTRDDQPRVLLAATLSEGRIPVTEAMALVEELSEEEALYWYSKCSGPNAARGLNALLHLLGKASKMREFPRNQP